MIMIISKKVDRYFDLAREVKKLWNLMVNIIPIELVCLKQSPGA